MRSRPPYAQRNSSNWRLDIAILRSEYARRALPNHSRQPARKEQWMRRRLRRSIPFLLAIFFGMIAGIVVAGIAILAAHS
jgi:hypothetical protein